MKVWFIVMIFLFIYKSNRHIIKGNNKVSPDRIINILPIH